MTDRRAEFPKGLGEKLADYLDHSKEYTAALDIVRRNSEGRIWLIGGTVYRTLAHLLYDNPIPTYVDLDFMIERGHTCHGEAYGDSYPCDEIHLPKQWQLHSHYGESRFVNTQKNLSIKVDIVKLRNLHSIRSQNLPPTLQNFLQGTPLTIQSMAYDVERREIIGDIGLKALFEKKVSVNYLNEARYYAYKKRVDLHEMIRQKAASLGFEAICPPPLDPPEGCLSFPIDIAVGNGELSLCAAEAGELSYAEGEGGTLSLDRE